MKDKILEISKIINPKECILYINEKHICPCCGRPFIKDSCDYVFENADELIKEIDSIKIPYEVNKISFDVNMEVELLVQASDIEDLHKMESICGACKDYKLDIELDEYTHEELLRYAVDKYTTPKELVTGFINDLTCNEHSHGSDERDLAAGWYDRLIS